MGERLKDMETLKYCSTVAFSYWRRLFMGLCLLLVWQHAVAQLDSNAENALVFSQTEQLFKKGNFSHFEIDPLGNVLLLGSGRQIIKYTPKGDSIGRYDNVRSYGEVTDLDVTNPLKIAVFYKDFAKIVALDRYLSPVNNIDLGKAGIWEASSVATSYDNQYWVFDKQEAKIKKISGTAVVGFASNDLRQVFDRDVNLVKLLDSDGLLYGYDPALGWYIFDYYGALKQKVELQNLVDVHVTGGVLTGRKGELLCLVSTKNLLTQPIWIHLPQNNKEVKQTYFDPASRRLWVLLQSGIFYYDIQTK